MNVIRVPVPSLQPGDESNFHRLCALPMMMFEGRTEEHVLELATESVSACGWCHVEAAYLTEDDALTPSAINGQPDRDLQAQAEALGGDEGAVTLSGWRWGWAFALRGLDRHLGYLVIAAPAEPSDDEFFLIKLLAQQTAAALVTASLHRKEREHARELRVARKTRTAAKERLEAAVSDLERHTIIHDSLTGVSASGEGEEGIVKAMHQLTGLAAAVEDRFGNLRAWAGPGRPASPYPKPDATLREELLSRAARRDHPVRDRDRLIALAQPRNEVLGVLALIDPARTAGRHEVFALAYGATVLALELAHQRNLAEMELRLRRDLVDDLITGTDQASAFARSESAGHDLHGPHYVAVVQWRDTTIDDAFAEAIGRAARANSLRSMLARLSDVVVLIIKGQPQGWALHEAVSRELGTTTGAIGISGCCESPADLPQSFHEALRALHIRHKSSSPEGVTAFDELGIYRILGTGDEETELFVREWLGALLDYDGNHHSNLVRTLSEYLDCGGNYGRTAQVLVIHRSTLRYRLQRIREITGLSLQDPDSRLNLHVATRAWKVLNGSAVGSPPCEPT